MRNVVECTDQRAEQMKRHSVGCLESGGPSSSYVLGYRAEAHLLLPLLLLRSITNHCYSNGKG